MRMRTYSRPLRVISAIVLFFFLWTFGPIWQAVAFAATNQKTDARGQTTDGRRSVSQQTSGERFEKALEEIREKVGQVEVKLEKNEDNSAELETIIKKRAEIESLDVELKKEFAATEKKLKDANLPKEILDRHYKFVKHYEDNLHELKTNLSSIEKPSAKSQELRAALQKAKAHLEKVKPPKKHVPLDPNKLPNRMVKAKARAPRLKKEEFEKDFPPQKKGGKLASLQAILAANELKWTRIKHKPVLLAFNGPTSDIPFQLPLPSENNLPLLAVGEGWGEGAIPSFDTLSAANYEPRAILLAQATVTPPAADDLSETPEVQFTPEIQALATQLNHNPVKIYEWVRNNIEFVPTYGSIQGAQMTLETKMGNSFDTASLLIALLRASGISARYVYGTVEIPIEKAMNWVGGVTDPKMAGTILATNGIPAKMLVSGGTYKAVQLEHTWVETYIPYGNYRGSIRDDSIKTWISLDASYKQYTYREPIDFPSAVGFDMQSFINEVQSASTISTVSSSISNVPQNLILQRFQEYVQNSHQYFDANLQNMTVEDIIGVKKVVDREYPYLIGSLPYKTITIGYKCAELPDALRYRIKFEVFSGVNSFDPDFSYTATTPVLAGKNITLSYKPATESDETLVQNYGYIEKVPPYLLNLTPVMIIAGEAVATGHPVGSGNDINFIMTFISPDGVRDVISNVETVGAYLGIGLDLNRLSKSFLDKKIASLDEIFNNPTTKASKKVQDSLSLLSSLYFMELDATNSIKARFAKVINIRLPSVGIVGAQLKIVYLWGMPRALSFDGLFVDVDRNMHATVAKDGDEKKAISFTINSGHSASALEHALWEQVYNLPGISTVKIHQIANERSIPIHRVDSSNAESIISLLQISEEIKSDIRNAVNAGKTVYIPQKNIQYYSWYGTGYIVIDPTTGAAGYIISSGMAGGGTGLSLDCIEALVELLDLVPLPGVIPGAILDVGAFAATLHDIAQSNVSPLQRGIAAYFAIMSLFLGLAGNLAGVGGPVGYLLTVLLSIAETMLYVSISLVLGEGIPFINSNPLSSCPEVIGGNV